MIGLLLPVCVAAVAGLALRRHYARSGGFHFTWWELAGIAFAIELLLYNPPVDSTPFALTYGPWVWVATRFALLAAVLRNVRNSRVFLVMALGIALNTVVIIANGGYMPQSVEAATVVWGQPKFDATRLQNTRPMDANSPLSFLGDTLPEPTWLPRANVLSIGDLVLSVGVGAWIFGALSGASNRGGDTSSVADMELGKDVFDMRFNRLHGHHELVGDRLI